MTRHPELGQTSWFSVRGGDRVEHRGAWGHLDLPPYASLLVDTVAFVWSAMDAFYEEDEQVLGHAADPYHSIDTRRSSRHLVARAGTRVQAETSRRLVLDESGFAPCSYVPPEVSSTRR